MNYNVTFSKSLDRELTKLAEKLNTTPADIIKRALMLLKHASSADEVRLIKNGIEQEVLVK